MSQTEKLLKIKSEIDKAKVQEAEAKGKMDSIMEQMKDKFGVETIEAAKNKLADMSSGIDKLEIQFNKGMEELEKSYDWGRD